MALFCRVCLCICVSLCQSTASVRWVLSELRRAHLQYEPKVKVPESRAIEQEPHLQFCCSGCLDWGRESWLMPWRWIEDSSWLETSFESRSIRGRSCCDGSNLRDLGECSRKYTFQHHKNLQTSGGASRWELSQFYVLNICKRFSPFSLDQGLKRIAKITVTSTLISDSPDRK